MSDSKEKDLEKSVEVPFTLALIAGGIAGTTVDVALYPIDTLRTRLQSPKGFWAAGGFSGVYTGVVATALGASPGAAFFFSAYETMKPVLKKMNGGEEKWWQASAASSCGEVAACLVRVPTSIVTSTGTAPAAAMAAWLSALLFAIDQIAEAISLRMEAIIAASPETSAMTTPCVSGT